MKYCDVCGEPLESVMTEKSKKVCDILHLYQDVAIGQIYPTTCQCELNRRNEEREQAELRDRIESMRRRGIADTLSQNMRFENDLGYNPDLAIKCKRYVDNFQKMYDENVGLIFTGGVGTGKTFYAACIANAVIDRGAMAVMTSLSRIIRTPFEEYDSALSLIERAALVVFDDLGAERDTSFAWERAFDAVDARIKSKKPLIVTTNFTPDEMAKATDIREKRIYDRILGACVIIPVVGQSIREIEHKKKIDTAREILSGK